MPSTATKNIVMQASETHLKSGAALWASEHIVTLEREGVTYYLIGTAHVSKKSVDEVCAVIDEVQPDTVCIELCETRYAAISDGDRWKNLDLFKVIKEGKTLLLLANLAIGAYQRKLGQQLGAVPGAEMIAAAHKAKQVGAQVALVDRNIQVTLKRTWGNLSLMRKAQLLGAILDALTSRESISAQDIEALKEQANLSSMMEEFAQALPDVKGPLIDERDRYMMTRIEAVQGKVIVAVVGAGHLPGMQAHFGQPVDLAQLEQLPKKSRWTGVLKWIIPCFIVVAFTVGYANHQDQSFEQLLYAWALPNAIVAAALTLVARAKMLSVITAFFVSPITSLNPLLGAGMIVGLVEAWLRKPTVADAERINDDVTSLRGMYKNPVTHVLLVAVLSSLGSALGAWIGASWVFSLIAR